AAVARHSFPTRRSSDLGIKMAGSMLIKKGEVENTNQIIDQLGLPLFVKPNAGGSSFGVTKVKQQSELITALKNAWNEGSDALVRSEEHTSELQSRENLV